MTIGLLGATGLLGRRLLELFLKEGHRPRVLVRSSLKLTSDLPDEDVTEGDGRDLALVRKTLTGCDCVVSALGMGDITVPHTNLSDCLRAIVKEMPPLGISRIVAVAGSGILPHPVGGLLMDHDWPAWLKHVSAEHERVWRVLSATSLNCCR